MPPPLAPPTIDLFQCYKVKRSRGSAKFLKQTMTIVDQFKTQAVLLKKPYLLCAPANKNGEGIPDPAAYLMCYAAKALPPQIDATPFTNSQFGTDSFGVFGAREFCVPSVVNP